MKFGRFEITTGHLVASSIAGTTVLALSLLGGRAEAPELDNDTHVYQYEERPSSEPTMRCRENLGNVSMMTTVSLPAESIRTCPTTSPDPAMGTIPKTTPY